MVSEGRTTENPRSGQPVSSTDYLLPLLRAFCKIHAKCEEIAIEADVYLFGFQNHNRESAGRKVAVKWVPDHGK